MRTVIDCAFRDSIIQSLYLSPSPFLTQWWETIKVGSIKSLDVVVSVLQTSLRSNTRLRNLDLILDDRLETSRILGLVRSLLLQNHTIESLKLVANLDNASLLPVAEVIRASDSLKELNLSYNSDISSVCHLMSSLMQRPTPLRLILWGTALGDDGVDEISRALESQVRLNQLKFALQTRKECTRRFFQSLSINEHLVDLNVGELNLETVVVLTDTMGSFTALGKLEFRWSPFCTYNPHKKEFLEAMKQNKTLLSVRSYNTPFGTDEIQLHTLRNLFHRYGRHEVAVWSGWPTGISSHLLCRFLPKNCPYIGQHWAMKYLKEISAGVGHAKHLRGCKRDRDEDEDKNVSPAGTAYESKN